MSGVNIRPLTLEDISVIHNWPAYPAEFGQMDYALRGKGWLADYYCKPNSWVYAAKVTDEMIAYSILAKTSSNSAEFRIALHPHKLHQGYGKIVTQMTLHKGFLELDFTRIYLIVRTDNTTAFRLYQSFGFQVNGNCTKIVNHESVDFIEMELLRINFANTEISLMNHPVTHGVHHIGLSVSRLEESASFFTSILGWNEIKRNEAYPAIYVSDGHIMVSLWQLKNDAPVHFDRHANIGLHHVALMLDKENDLNIIHEQLLQHAIEIEFSPEPLGKGPARHLMCLEPSGIRVEFIWPGNT